MTFESWTYVIVNSLQNLWLRVVEFVPVFLGALIVLVVGLIVASGIGALVEKAFSLIRLDEFLKKLGLEPYFERANMKLHGSWFLGKVAQWFLIVAFLLAASDILGLSTLSLFLRDVLVYIPNVVIAVLIMLAAAVVGNVARRLVQGSVMSAKLSGAHFLGTLTWWSIVLFGFFAALIQLNVAPTVINALVMGFVAMLAIAGGLAFGLGGKEYAAHLIARLREHTEGKK
ncbi:MAG: hypothetical protein AAB495_04410 [Patescibacteria group bacterium]